jgi:hypothetical protein
MYVCMLCVCMHLRLPSVAHIMYVCVYVPVSLHPFDASEAATCWDNSVCMYVCCMYVHVHMRLPSFGNMMYVCVYICRMYVVCMRCMYVHMHLWLSSFGKMMYICVYVCICAFEAVIF